MTSGTRRALAAMALALCASCTAAATRNDAEPAGGSPGAAEGMPGDDPDSTAPVVVLDPGHNGGNATHAAEIARPVPAGFGEVKPCNTVGTQTGGGYPEHAYAFDVARRTEQLLTARGVRVRLTRPDDDGVGPCVNNRARIGNDQRAAAVVSIHADGATRGHGFHVIEAARPPAGPGMAKESHRLAVTVHAQFEVASGFTPSTYVGEDGFDHRDDLAGLNLSTRPAILLEVGNMRDPGDAAHMEDPDGRQRAAQALAAGILRYLGR